MSMSSTKKKNPEKTFYVPHDFQQDFETLLNILKREGKSLSEWMREKAREYNNQHREGNWQLRIDKYSVVSNHKTRKPSDCHFWRPRPKAQPPYEAFCSKRKLMVLAASCCDLWKT